MACSAIRKARNAAVSSALNPRPNGKCQTSGLAKTSVRAATSLRRHRRRRKREVTSSSTTPRSCQLPRHLEFLDDPPHGALFRLAHVGVSDLEVHDLPKLVLQEVAIQVHHAQEAVDQHGPGPTEHGGDHRVRRYLA